MSEKHIGNEPLNFGVCIFRKLERTALAGKIAKSLKILRNFEKKTVPKLTDLCYSPAFQGCAGIVLTLGWWAGFTGEVGGVRQNICLGCAKL